MTFAAPMTIFRSRAPWVTRPTQCLPADKYLMSIPGPANSQGFARDTASNPPGIFHNSKNCRLGRPGYFPRIFSPDIFPGYFPNCRLNFPAAFSRRRCALHILHVGGLSRSPLIRRFNPRSSATSPPAASPDRPQSPPARSSSQ